MSEGSLGEECDWKEPPDRARTGWLLPQGKGVWGQARGSILLRPTPIPTLIARRYLDPLLDTDADTLILGCTHYPLLHRVISRLYPHLTLINTGTEAARLLRTTLPPCKEEQGDAVRYFVSDDVEGFSRSASLFLQTEVRGSVAKIDIAAY